MKVDGLGVVLAIILMPIILIVTYYIQLQVDTIATENQYNTKLLDATYDAMSAFEINTANEELSTVADSMRSIVLASNNVFLNTLATNLGISNASKEYLQPYIPSMLYTMYDGYYIYSPTQTAKVAEKTEEDGELVTTKGYLSVGDEGTEHLGGTYGDIVYEKEDGTYTLNKDDAKQVTDYILKPYIQYSARYAKTGTSKGNIDVTINYTLDNYINVIGNVGNIYYTKTGYLIKKDLVTEAKADGVNLLDLNEDDIKNKILGMKVNAQGTTTEAASNASVKVDGVDIKAEWQNIKDALAQMGYPEVKTIEEAEIYLEKSYEENKELIQIQKLEYEIGKYKAIVYYASSKVFSDWIYDNLKDLEYRDIIDEAVTNYYASGKYETTSGAGESDLYYSFEGNSTKIFDATQDPEVTDSNFNTHKLEVIKNSIKYNLNLTMSAYNNMFSEYEASLPILLDEEWDKVLSNISIVSFMQGWDCGLDVYNSYQIVSSTNNELTVTPREIYYVKKDEFNNGTGNYHRIDCPHLEDSAEYISFKSKEVKYDKIYDKNNEKYKYNHKNLACYTCINNSNYEPIATENEQKKLARYIGLAKERQNIYKTNALPVSQGSRVIFKTPKTIAKSNTDFESVVSGLNEKNVKKLQITISDTTHNKVGTIIKEPILKLKLRINGGATAEVTINGNQKNAQTINIDISSLGEINSIDMANTTAGYEAKYTVQSIKAIYE